MHILRNPDYPTWVQYKENLYHIGVLSGSLMVGAVGGASGYEVANYYLSGVSVSAPVLKLVEDIHQISKKSTSHRKRMWQVWEAVVLEFVPVYLGSALLGIAQFYSIAGCMGHSLSLVGMAAGLMGSTAGGLFWVIYFNCSRRDA